MKIFSLKTLVPALLIASGCLTMAAENAPAGKNAPEFPPMAKRNMANRKRPAFTMTPAIKKTAKELKAYQANPTPENFAAFEKAFNAAVQEDTAAKKAFLEKQLAELEKNQKAQADMILAKVKSGEFKMPSRPPRNRQMPIRRRPGKPAKATE
ncbi:MAG: hypothetical protein J6S19_04565 [Lentisphaeria bacterium]|nr:hypothetical protein [Lentisphaeria bacterium]